MDTKVLALLLLLASSFFFATSEAHQDKKNRKHNKKKKSGALPVVINTWAFVNATAKAWETIFDLNLSAIDAVERGCSVCEEERCDGTVGYGGSPDENGETTLDAMVMDGTSMDVGAVGALRRVKGAISVARHVLERTRHTLLVGDQATEFAKAMGFPEETLQTEESRNIWADWKARSCQPNFWTNVLPDPGSSCGPYRPANLREQQRDDDESLNSVRFSRYNHDTIGMVVVDAAGKVVAGTSTNGARHKIPGRVGDSPIPGAGAYADSQVGGAAATGDGDVMMRFLPSFHAVEELRRGATPEAAAEAAVGRITSRHPDFMGGVVVVSKSGDYGAACHGMDTFPFSVRNVALGRVVVEEAACGPPGAAGRVITL